MLLASLSALGGRLKNALQNGIRTKRDRCRLLWGDAVRMRLSRALEQRRQASDELHAAIALQCARRLENRKNRLEREKERLFAYDPQRTLERGFAIVGRENGAIVRSVDGVDKGDAVSIRFADGTAHAKITGKESI